MRIMKRWLAPVLTAAILLGDCGSIPVFATEDATAVETSISENNADSDEIPADGESGSELIFGGDTKKEEAENTETELPTLHIGQIKKGEELPSPKDSAFVYDLPVSFDTTDHLVLFANYSIDTTLKNYENGTISWSILRGEKGLEPGSANLLNEEDDWTGFETVSSSPFFVMEEITDKESEYDQMMALTFAEPSFAAHNSERSETVEASEKYDYYIRAAYYPETENGKAEAFYAAATVPFLPANDTAIDNDASDAGEIPTDIIPNDLPDTGEVSADITEDDMAVTEDTDQAETQDNALIAEETDIEQTPEETVSENSVTAQAMEAVSTLSEDDDTQQQPTEERFGVLTLSAESVTLHTGDTLSVSASLVPNDSSAKITWKSNNDAVATVDANGKITAVTAGDALITAKCGYITADDMAADEMTADDITAAVKVKVLAGDDAEVYDLSGDIWVYGFQRESDDLVYTGQKITQDIRVYHKETLLTEKTDYTLSYKNNINAAAWNSAKAPCVTITMKGQYQGSVTLYYTIKPADIKATNIYTTSEDIPDEDDPDKTVTNISGYEQAVTYATNLTIPNPVLTFGKKTLAVNKDFICDYSTLPTNYKKGDSYEAGKVYTYTVNGIGNFAGAFPMQLVILKDKNMNFSSAAVTLGAKQYEYDGAAPTNVTIKTLKINNKLLEEKFYAYTVFADGIEGAYVMVYPSPEGQAAGYRGSKKVNLKLVGARNIADADEGNNWKPSITFSQKTLNDEGGMFQEKEGVLTFGTGAEKVGLKENVDYTVKYSNAKKAGTVTVTFTGKGRYKGTLRKTYVITPNTAKTNFTIRWKNVTRKNDGLVITYQKGGAVPDFVLLDQNNNVLKNKTDYAIKLKNNNAPGNMSCEITGKGNYKGYTETIQIAVKNGDISQCTLSVPDKPYSAKANAWKSKVTVKDVNGKTLAAGKDYEKEVTYSYPGMENEESPAPGTTVTVTVKGMNYYAADTDSDSSLTGSYRIFRNNISRLQIVIDDQEYTGKEITLSSSAIHVYANAADKRAKKELTNATSCYQIVEYKNNIKAGTAKVTLQGIGDYGGTKTCSFKILKKAYLTNRVEKITLDNKNLNISLAEKGKRTLTATLTPKDASQRLTNPTVIWSTSNSNIATVEAVETATDDNTDTETDTKNDLTVTASITVKKTGTVTITATAQDGNKKAACTVKISVPALKEKGQTIKRKTGETYQLSFVKNGDSEIDMENFTFESDNTTVASVNKQGLITMNRFGMATIQVYVGNKQAVQQCYVIVERAGDEELNDSKVLTYNRQAGVNDTEGINALLRQAEWSNGKYDTVYIPAGTYTIDAVPTSKDFGGLILTDNQNLILSPDAKLVVRSNNSKDYHVIWAFGRSNVFISGGKIEGDRTTHKGSGEWGHGIQISGCKNVYISDVDVSNCWGDGIYLGFYDGPNVCSNGVTIENCKLYNNRRNNLSITDASNVTIRKCQFNNANGTDPQYGIDIEPNAGRPCKNIKIYDSTFTGNRKASLGIMTPASDIRLEGCTLDGQLINWSGTNVVLKNTTVKGGVTGQNAGNVRYE